MDHEVMQMSHDEVVRQVQVIAPVIFAKYFNNEIMNDCIMSGYDFSNILTHTYSSKEEPVRTKKIIDNNEFIAVYDKYKIDLFYKIITINSNQIFNNNDLEAFKILTSISQKAYDLICKMSRKKNDKVQQVTSYLRKFINDNGIYYELFQETIDAFTKLIEINENFNKDNLVFDINYEFRNFKAYSIVFEIKNTEKDVLNKNSEILYRLKDIKSCFNNRSIHKVKCILIGNKGIFSPTDKQYFNIEQDIFFEFREDLGIV